MPHADAAVSVESWVPAPHVLALPWSLSLGEALVLHNTPTSFSGGLPGLRKEGAERAGTKGLEVVNRQASLGGN